MTGSSRVFITGLSALTACGNTIDDTWNAVISGESGIDAITQWDLTDWACRLGGELKDFNPAKMLPDRKLIKMISRQDAMGICAATHAVAHSQLLAYNEEAIDATFNESTGVYVGSPGNKYLQQYDFLPLLAKSQGEMKSFAAQLFDEVHPMWLLRILPNNVLAYTGMTYQFKGPNHNITNHAVSGTQAILEAYHAIKAGQIERAVVIAYDMGIEPQALFYYEKLGVISSQHLRPFDATHDGTILAEGAAALVLESEKSARKRDATCYGELLGGMAASEVAGLFSIQSEGERLAQLLQRTLSASELDPAEISFLVAHGNANPKSDYTEAQAIQAVFAPHSVPVTAFKWAMGHTLCASGIIDAVLTAKALQEKIVPGIANFMHAAPGCEPLNLFAKSQSLGSNAIALMLNRGFASMNACLVIKACE